MNYLGLDPGVSGGLALLNEAGEVVAVQKMPATEKDLWTTVADMRSHGECFAMVEKLGGMPRGKMKRFQKCARCGANNVVWIDAPLQSPTTMFVMGGNYGGLRMACVGLLIPLEEVLPRTWQQEAGVIMSGRNYTSTQKKNIHKAKAQRLFPDVKVTHMIADALLIAEYARRQMCLAEAKPF